MTEPITITIDQVTSGDTILVRRVENAGTDNEIVTTIQGVVSDVSKSGRLIGFRGSLSWYSAGDTGTITLIHRPPTRHKITFDDLCDWRNVPIGTRIEFESDVTGVNFCGKISMRTQHATDWCVRVKKVGDFYFRDIKEDTLFVIEEAKP